MGALTDSKRRGEAWLVTAAGFAVGPGMAGLHEFGILSLGPAATLWPIGVIVLAAVAGLVTGLGVAARVSRLLGTMVAVPNLLVLALYGFLLLFFGLGGSR